MNIRALVFLGLAVIALDASAAEKRLDKSFAVKAGGSLHVDADSASITVKGGSTDQVRVQMQFEGSSSSLDRLILSAEASSDGVEVKAKRDNADWHNWLSFGSVHKAEITISVPQLYNVDLKTSGGGIDIDTLSGQVKGATSGGGVRVHSISGPVRMHTSGGSVSATDIHGETIVGTSGGRIDAARIVGSLRAETSGGGIDIVDVHGPVTAETSGGSVSARAVVGDVHLSSSSGSIRAEADGEIVAETSGGRIDVVLLGANRGINASTSGGSITINVPKTADASFDASTSGGSVTSDLPIARTSSDKKSLKGTLNGGGALITARTSGGGIQLQSSR